MRGSAWLPKGAKPLAAFVFLFVLFSWGVAFADEAPAARAGHRWFEVAIGLMREDVEAGVEIGRYTSERDGDGRVGLINRLATIAEGGGGVRAMKKLEAAWRDVGTASWEGIYQAGVRCSDALLDGGRVLTFADAARVPLFIRMTEGVEPGIRDAVILEGEARGGGAGEKGGGGGGEKIRSVTRLGVKGKNGIALWVDGEGEEAAVLRAWVRDAVVVLIGEEVAARTEEHREAVKKIRPKRD